MSASLQSILLKDWDDQRLLKSLYEGNKLALSELYGRYWYALYQVALQKTRSQETAEELVQDLFVQLWQKRESLAIRQVESYLFGALKYSIIDYIKGKMVREKYQQHQQLFASAADTSTENHLAYHDLLGTIESELQKLPVKTQEVFRMSRFEGMTIPEISRHLALTDKAVEYHLSKALKLLRSQLRDYSFVLLLIMLAYS